MEKLAKVKKLLEYSQNKDLSIWEELTEISEELKDVNAVFGGINLDSLRKAIHLNKGEDGRTPVKGVDYFTEKEIEQIAAIVQNRIRIPKDGRDGRDGRDLVKEQEIKEQKEKEEAINNFVHVGLNAPENPKPGSLWFKADIPRSKENKEKVFVGIKKPKTVKKGDFWIKF